MNRNYFPTGSKVRIRGSKLEGVLTGVSASGEHALILFTEGTASIPFGLLENTFAPYELLPGDIWRLLNGWEYAGRTNKHEGGVGLIPLDTLNGQKYVPPNEALEYLHMTGAKLVRRRDKDLIGGKLHDHVYGPNS